MSGRLNLSPRPEWAPTPRERTETTEHRCGKCFGPYGKSAIRCVNEPDPEPKKENQT